MLKFIVKWSFLIIFPMLFNGSLRAQNESAANKTIYSVETSYSSNTLVYGVLDHYAVQPSYNANLDIQLNKNFNLYLSPTSLGNSDSTNHHSTSEFAFGATYQLKLNENLTLTPSFSHFVFSKNTTALSAGFNNYADVNAGLTVDWWELNASTGYGYGKTTDFFVNLASNVNIRIENFAESKNALVFQPGIDFSFNKGSLSRLNDLKRTSALSDVVKLYPNITVNEFLTSTIPAIVTFRQLHPAIVANVNNLLTRKRKKVASGTVTANTPLSSIVPSTTKNTFGLVSINLFLPISYEINNFAIKAELAYCSPTSQNATGEFFATIGVAYSF